MKDEIFPADVILLNGSDSKGCYVETKNLDGETNLKHKKLIKEVARQCFNDHSSINMTGYVDCEKPNDKIYLFEGVFYLDYQRHPTSEKY